MACEMHALIEDKIEQLEASCKRVKTNLFGNGEMGTSQKADKAYSYMKRKEASKNGFYDWLFRAIVIIILGWIASKVGLK